MKFVFRAQVPQPRADRPCRSRYRPLTARPPLAPGYGTPGQTTPGHPSPPSIPTPPSIETPPACLPLELPSRPVVFSASKSYSLLSGSNSRFFLLLHSHLSHSLEQSSLFSSSSFLPHLCHNLSLSLPILNSNFIVAAHLSLSTVVSLSSFPRRLFVNSRLRAAISRKSQSGNLSPVTCARISPDIRSAQFGCGFDLQLSHTLGRQHYSSLNKHPPPSNR